MTPNKDLNIIQGKSQAGKAKPGTDTTPEDPNKPVATDDDIDLYLKELIKYAEDEDDQIRYRLARLWRRNDLYFNNIQKIFYDEVARDYRTIDSVASELAKFGPIDDIKTVNIYRPLAESLIAALAVTPPTVDFPPEDADEPDDIETSETFTKVGELVSNHNEAQLKLIKGLTILHNSGTLVGLNYYKTDPAYGFNYSPKSTNKKEVQLSDIRCPKCGDLLDAGLPGNVLPETSKINCPECKYQGPPNVFSRLDYEEEVTDWDKTPKGRSGFDLFSPIQAKLPLYARAQEHCGYCIIRIEDNVAKFKKVYDRDDIQAGSGDTNKYERWARLPIEYLGQLPQDIATIRYAYFRPWFYYTLSNEKAKALEQAYPKGVMVAIIEDDIMESQDIEFDKCLTVTYDPRSNFIHGEAAGNSIVPIQDAKNDIFNLGLQSIEYGIPETFAHPKTLNVTKYGQKPAAPGMVTNALPPSPDKSLADGFYTLKTATLSNEYTSFDKSLDGLGQLISGAFPSIYGGGMDDGSKTATEYTESRSRALQRLQIVWQMISVFWRKMIAKCVIDYVENLREDEAYAQRHNGTYINIWIKKSSLGGKVGHVNLELESELPQSWAQIQGVVMKLIGLQNPQIAEVLLHPNNSELVKRALGTPQFYIPGANDRNKQFREYYKLSTEKPIDEQTPSVDIDIDVDDHQVEMLVLKNILVSSIGINLYQTNSDGYKNCILHYRKHEMALQAKTQAPASGSPANTPPPTAAQTKEG